MSRISMLAVQLRKSVNGNRPRGAIVDGSSLPGLPPRPDNAGESVWLTEQRLWRLLEKRKELDREAAREAFARYDANDNGVLELSEIRAMLVDLGLYPATPEEKAVIRRALLELAALGQGPGARTLSAARTVSFSLPGEGPVEEEPAGPVRRAAMQIDTQDSGLDGLVQEWHIDNPQRPGRSSLSRRSSGTVSSEDDEDEDEENGARTVFLTPESVGGFVTQVRTGLMQCRREGVMELFRRYDLFNSGVLDLSTVFDILVDRKLMPKEWELQRFLCETFVDEEGEPSKSISFKGWEHFKRRHAAVPVNCQEFLHLFHFLQQSDEQSASETEWAEAKRFGVTDVKLYMALREEIPFLHRTLRRRPTGSPRSQRAVDEGGGSFDKNEVWVALNTLGLFPPGMDKAKILKVVKKSCTHGELKTGSTYGLTALGSRLVEGWASSKLPARMSFEDFLRVLVKVRELVRRDESFHLWPVFARYHRPIPVGHRRTSGLASGVDERVIDTAGVFRALQDLGMDPTDSKAQDSFRSMLDDANEFCMDPLALDFGDFSSFVRRAREWLRCEGHAREAEDAHTEYDLDEWRVGELRTAFDFLDREGKGRLPVAAVPKICKVFGWGEEPQKQRETRLAPSRSFIQDGGAAEEAAAATVDFGGVLREASRRLEAERRAQRVKMTSGKLDEELQLSLRAQIADVEDVAKRRSSLSL